MLHFTAKRGFNRNISFTIKQFKNPSLITQIIKFYVLGFFVNFLVIFGHIWEDIVFLKGLVELGEIRNIKD